MSVAEIKQEIEALGTKDRIALAAYLDQLFISDKDTGLSKEWSAELRRRTDEIDSGKIDLLPWSEVRSELERDFG